MNICCLTYLESRMGLNNLSAPHLAPGSTICKRRRNYVLSSYAFFFIANETDIFFITLPILPNVEHSSNFFCRLLLALGDVTVPFRESEHQFWERRRISFKFLFCQISVYFSKIFLFLKFFINFSICLIISCNFQFFFYFLQIFTVISNFFLYLSFNFFF